MVSEAHQKSDLAANWVRIGVRRETVVLWSECQKVCVW